MDLPPVEGRHRNTALASARREAAISLVLSGSTYQAAADELGYANRGTVHRIVHQALTNREAETIDELRALEIDRLDAVQRAHWDAALAGDTTAARLVLRIIDQRSRLLGLYDRPPVNRSTTDPHPVLMDFDPNGHLIPV